MTTTALRDWTDYDYVAAIMQYEGSDQSPEDSLRLFQYLVDTGLAWKLQGHYGRTASALIQKGLIAKSVHEAPTHTLDDYR